MFEHQHAVRGGNRDRAARTAFADDNGDIGHAEVEAGIGGSRDRFGLSAFLSADAGIGACGVHQRQHGDTEMICHFHQPHGLAIAFGLGHAEIMLEPGFGGRTLFLADHADAFAAEASEAADQCFVVAELAVARERRELGDERLDVIHAMRPQVMTRDLGFLPGREIGIKLDERLRRLLLDARHFLADVAAAGGKRAQLVHLGVEFGDGFFKIQIAAHQVRHVTSIRGGRDWAKGARIGRLVGLNRGLRSFVGSFKSRSGPKSSAAVKSADIAGLLTGHLSASG